MDYTFKNKNGDMKIRLYFQVYFIFR